MAPPVGEWSCPSCGSAEHAMERKVGDRVEIVCQRCHTATVTVPREPPPPPRPSGALSGKVLAGRYEIRSELGRGGMGIVYRAFDPLLSREVAVKLVPPLTLETEAEERLQREARAVAQLDHPGIVTIHDIGRHEGALFFVMPLLRGDSLRALVRARSLSLADVVSMGIQVAEAMEHCHAQGIIHRDIKPENIMVSREETGLRARVMDFGLARGTEESRLTGSKVVVGTVSYFSPEQIGKGRVDARTDIYALGTSLYECLVGEPPFLGELYATLYRIVHDTPPSPRALGAAIGEELERIVLRCLEKEPAARYQRSAELAEALRRYQAAMKDSDRATMVLKLERPARPEREIQAPLVGRRRELSELEAIQSAALAGQCQLVLLGGPAGIGKTRLASELEALARSFHVQVLHGRAAQDSGLPYQPFCEAIQEHVRARETGSQSGPAPDLTDLAPDLCRLFPVLHELPPFRKSTPSQGVLPSHEGRDALADRTSVYEILARALARIAGGKPLLVTLENLHEADVSIEALAYLVRRLGPTPILFIGAYRPDALDRNHPLRRLIESFGDDPRVHSIAIGPLPPAEHRAYLELCLGDAAFGSSLAQRIYETTEGNPLFTRELVRSLEQSGQLAKDETGAWSLSGRVEMPADALPATIQQVVERRIEALPDDLRNVLALASVLGRRFEYDDLAALMDEPRSLEDAVDRLVREGLLSEERGSRGDALAFSSGVLRDVLYAGLPRRRRRATHKRHAEALETKNGARLERVCATLLHHFAEADVPEKVVTYGLMTARAALLAHSPEDAARSARLVLEFVAGEKDKAAPALEGQARMLLARAHRMARNLEAAVKEVGRVVPLLAQPSGGEGLVEAMLFAAETTWEARKVEDCLRYAEAGIVAARDTGEVGSLIKLLALAATLRNLRGERDKARALHDEMDRTLTLEREKSHEDRVPLGGRLVTAFGRAIETVDPVHIQLIEESELLANVFETLVATDEHGAPVPLLCESWEVAGAGQTLLLTLRSGVKLHDGTVLEATVLKECFERAIRAALRLPPAYAALRGVEEYRSGTAPEVAGLRPRSPTGIELGLRAPLPIYPALLTDMNTAVARQAKDGCLVGTGPFRIVERGAGRIVLERNTDYWRKTCAALDAIEFRTGVGAAEMAGGLRSGELDLARDLAPADLEEALRSTRLHAELAEEKNICFALFDCTEGSRLPRSVRQALQGIVHTQDLVWQTLGPFARPAIGLYPPGTLGHDVARRPQTMTLQRAQAKLLAAAVPRPLPLRAAVHPVFLDRYGALLEALLATWSRLGVEVEVINSDYESYRQCWLERAGADVLLGRWIADYDDPDSFTYQLFHSLHGLLRHFYSSPEADLLMEQARSHESARERLPLYRQIEALLLAQGALLPLCHDIDYRVAGPRIVGMRVRNRPPYVNYAEIGKLHPSTRRDRARADSALLVAVASNVASLDPAAMTSDGQGEVIGTVYETLTRAGDGARVVPGLASEIASLDDGRRYRIRLQSGVRFHDGRPLSARDVRYSLERLLALGTTPARHLFAPIKGARALLEGQAKGLEGLQIVTGQEIHLVLDEPLPILPALLSHPASSILPEAGDPKESPVGTGPFRVVRLREGKRVDLERNPHYWRRGYPKEERLCFVIGLTPEETLVQFRAGKLALAGNLLPRDAAALREDARYAPGYQEMPSLSTAFAAVDVNRGALADARLRRRMIAALPVTDLVGQTIGRAAIPARSLIPPGLVPAEARSFVDDASFGEHSMIDLDVAVHPALLARYPAFFRELDAAARTLGAHVVLSGRGAQEASAPDILVGYWNAAYADPDAFVHGVLHTEGGLCGRLCGSREIDDLIERARRQADPSLRHSIYRSIEDLIDRRALLLPLFHEQHYRFVQPGVSGLKLGLSLPRVLYEELRLA